MTIDTKYLEFEKFFKVNLSIFCKEKNLNIQNKYYSKEYSLIQAVRSNDQVISLIQDVDIKKLYLGDYGNTFVRYLLDNANEEQRKIIILNEFYLFDVEQLGLSSYEHPQDMKDIFREFSKQKVYKSFQWENLIKDMQENCGSQLYDEVIDIFLAGQLKEIKNKNNKIIINLMLNTVKDDAVYEKYNSLIPDNVINDDFFDTLKINCFDLNVSKDKLYSAVSLPNKDKYNDMHLKLLEKLNDEKVMGKLDIISIDGEAKFKSSKYYRYVCRVKEGGLLDKNSTKLLIISFCKLYAQTIANARNKDGEREYELLNNISPEMIHSHYLSYKLSKNLNEENKSNKEKKPKI